MTGLWQGCWEQEEEAKTPTGWTLLSAGTQSQTPVEA